MDEEMAPNGIKAAAFQRFWTPLETPRVFICFVMHFAFSTASLNTNRPPKWFVYDLVFVTSREINYSKLLKKCNLPPFEDPALFLGFSSSCLLGVGYVQPAAVLVILWWLTGVASPILYISLKLKTSSVTPSSGLMNNLYNFCATKPEMYCLQPKH